MCFMEENQKAQTEKKKDGEEKKLENKQKSSHQHIMQRNKMSILFVLAHFFFLPACTLWLHAFYVMYELCRSLLLQ